MRFHFISQIGKDLKICIPFAYKEKKKSHTTNNYVRHNIISCEIWNQLLEEYKKNKWVTIFLIDQCE